MSLKETAIRDGEFYWLVLPSEELYKRDPDRMGDLARPGSFDGLERIEMDAAALRAKLTPNGYYILKLRVRNDARVDAWRGGPYPPAVRRRYAVELL